jgi:hypothetical protein
VAVAEQNPDSIMSIIIDGMDQSNCEIPYHGTQAKFGSEALKMGITGIKEHGVGVTIYRTVETVSKGADLTIYCILRQLERWIERHDNYPEELYIQVLIACTHSHLYEHIVQ